MANPNPSPRLPVGLAVFFVLAGLAAFAMAVGSTSARLQRMERKAADLERIHVLRQPVDRLQSLVRGLEALPTLRARPAADVLREALPAAAFDTREEEPRSLGQGWSARRSEIAWASIAAADFGRALHALEVQRPPWRMVECVIAAAPGEPGRLRVNLSLESLEKTGE